MKVEKNGVVYTVRDDIQLSAFLTSGYHIVEEKQQKRSGSDGKQ